MEQRVSLITLGVSELERSRLFYTEGLGWTPGFVSDEVVFFQAGPLIVSLFPFAALAEDAQVPVAAGSAGFALAHNVRSKAEVDAVLARAETAGARLRSPPRRSLGEGTRATSPIRTATSGRLPGTPASRSRRMAASCWAGRPRGPLSSSAR
ncbi:Glyoxalase-like domain protein [compost metagenome]